MMFHGYYDFLLNDIKLKPKHTTLHQKNLSYLRKQEGEYLLFKST